MNINSLEGGITFFKVSLNAIPRYNLIYYHLIGLFVIKLDVIPPSLSFYHQTKDFNRADLSLR